MPEKGVMAEAEYGEPPPNAQWCPWWDHLIFPENRRCSCGGTG